MKAHVLALSMTLLSSFSVFAKADLESDFFFGKTYQNENFEIQFTSNAGSEPKLFLCLYRHANETDYKNCDWRALTQKGQSLRGIGMHIRNPKVSGVLELWYGSNQDIYISTEGGLKIREEDTAEEDALTAI